MNDDIAWLLRELITLSDPVSGRYSIRQLFIVLAYLNKGYFETIYDRKFTMPGLIAHLENTLDKIIDQYLSTFLQVS